MYQNHALIPLYSINNLQYFFSLVIVGTYHVVLDCFVFLMKSLSDKVEFFENGTKVCITFVVNE